jgi:predicted RNase H-like HicB family nuclease
MYDGRMAERAANADNRIQSEERGNHWVAWVAGADGKPERSVVLVGETREEAEERAREWGKRSAAR